ncbi:protein of unknown function (DU1801) [Amycolatopsis marina]|uniref:YdhG-like domain-containing protein n=1 Tax=Amycolatopsis marina TaxID=490629 RepID=A0A1I1B9G4_9PSEU|nr:DUF1801 domain-containing protein [Amycolatopsis marina]SFB46432.1 protein of unknown function (DU1801) [Amycolatopsis marina]
MKGTSAAATPEEYFDALDEPRRGELLRLHELIRAVAPRLTPTMEFGMPGYGTYHYRYASGREGDWVLVALASNKKHISLHVTAVVEGQYLAESYRDRLPKASIGKSCIRFSRLALVDLDVLGEIVRTAAAHPPYPLT